MPKKNTETQPWERQDRESSPAYEAFSMYRDMPKNGQKRSTRVVAEQLGKSVGLIERWCSQKSWVARVTAYDNFLTREDQRQHLDELKKMRSRQVKIAMQLQNAALEALAVTKPGDIAPKDIVSFIKAATAIEESNRKAQVETDRAESPDNDDSGVIIYIPDNGRD